MLTLTTYSLGSSVPLYTGIYSFCFQVDWEERRRVVKEQCRADPVLLPAQNQFDEGTVGEKVVAHYRRIHEKQLVLNIVHVPKLNLNWCLVPKVASTSISAAILPHLIFGGESQESKFLQKEVWRRAGHLKYEEYRAGQNVTPSFLVTRHPFARVASAFRNKLEDRTKSHDGEYFYNIFSKQIIKSGFYDSPVNFNLKCSTCLDIPEVCGLLRQQSPHLQSSSTT